MRRLIVILLVLFSHPVVAEEAGDPAATSPVESGRVDIDGFSLEYESAGRGERTVLLEAGVGWGLSTWDSIVEELRRLLARLD